MMRRAKKYLLVPVLIVVGLVVIGGLCACSKEEIRRALPAKRGF